MTTIPLIYWIGGAVTLLTLVSLFYLYSHNFFFCKNTKL
jgi:hypothetical protein